MKLQDLMERKSENSDIQKAPPPGKLGKFITAKQAAKILGVTPSRVRQFIAEDRLKAYAPEVGRRDNMLSLSEVEAFKKEDRERTGRPPEKKTRKKKN